MVNLKDLLNKVLVKINKIVVEDKDIFITKENFIAHPKKKSFLLNCICREKRYGLIELVS